MLVLVSNPREYESNRCHFPPRLHHVCHSHLVSLSPHCWMMLMKMEKRLELLEIKAVSLKNQPCLKQNATCLSMHCTVRVLQQIKKAASLRETPWSGLSSLIGGIGNRATNENAAH